MRKKRNFDYVDKTKTRMVNEETLFMKKKLKSHQGVAIQVQKQK